MLGRHEVTRMQKENRNREVAALARIVDRYLSESSEFPVYVSPVNGNDENGFADAVIERTAECYRLQGFIVTIDRDDENAIYTTMKFE